MALRGGRKGVTTTLPPECNADTKTLDFRSLVIGFHSLGPGHWVSVQSSGTRVAGIQCGPGPRFKSIVFTVSQSIQVPDVFLMVCNQHISCANIVDGSSRLHNPQTPALVYLVEEAQVLEAMNL